MSVQDELEIKRIINLYGFAVDTQHWELFDQIFTHDVDADYSETSHWRDLATLKSDFDVFHAPFDGTQHAMMSHLVNVRGDQAWAMTYATWRLIRKGLAGGEFWEGTGWYDDVRRARHGAAHNPGAAAVCDDPLPGRMAKGKDAGQLLRGRRPDDHGRRWRQMQERIAAAGGNVLTRQQTAITHDRPEFFQQGRADRHERGRYAEAVLARLIWINSMA